MKSIYLVIFILVHAPMASAGVLHDLAKENNEKRFSQYLSKGFDPNRQNQKGVTPLQIASAYGHVEIVRTLLNLPTIQINQGNLQGLTPLHWASIHNRVDALELLLKDSRIDINKQDNQGNTPLHRAVNQSNKQAVSMLLAHGADFYIKNKHNDTAAYLSFFIGNPQVIDVFLRKSPGIFERLKVPRIETGLRYEDFFQNQSHFLRENSLKAIQQRRQDILSQVLDATVRISIDKKEKAVYGSGFFVSEDIVVTNQHVIADTQLDRQGKKYALLSKENNYHLFTGVVIAEDKESDLALLKVSKPNKTYFKLKDPSRPRNGERVFAVGSPKGKYGKLIEFKYLDHTRPAILNNISQIFSINRLYAMYCMITCPPIPLLSGASGSPLITKDLQVLGVLNASFFLEAYKDEDPHSAGFAQFIPVYTLKKFLKQNAASINKPLPKLVFF